MRRGDQRTVAQGASMAELLRANEYSLRGEAETLRFLDRVIDTFFACIDRRAHQRAARQRWRHPLQQHVPRHHVKRRFRRAAQALGFKIIVPTVVVEH